MLNMLELSVVSYLWAFTYHVFALCIIYISFHTIVIILFCQYSQLTMNLFSYVDFLSNLSNHQQRQNIFLDLLMRNKTYLSFRSTWSRPNDFVWVRAAHMLNVMLVFVLFVCPRSLFCSLVYTRLECPLLISPSVSSSVYIDAYD